MQRERIRYFFLLPGVILILALSIFPLLFSLYLAFSKWQPSSIGIGIRFIGIKNFVDLYHDANFRITLINTLFYVIVGTIVEGIIGFGLALLLSQNIKGKKFFRVVFLMPMMLTPVAVAYMWKMLLDETMGPINFFLKHIGIHPVSWLSNPSIAKMSILIIDAWEWIPFMMIIFLAALQSLPQEPYEAAYIDGATGFKALIYITLPLIYPIIITAALLRGVEMFKIFDVIMITTGGGPGLSTASVSIYGYYVAMKHFNLGYASAISYVLLATIIILSMTYLNIFRERTKVIS